MTAKANDSATVKAIVELFAHVCRLLILQFSATTAVIQTAIRRRETMMAHGEIFIAVGREKNNGSRSVLVGFEDVLHPAEDGRCVLRGVDDVELFGEVAKHCVVGKVHLAEVVVADVFLARASSAADSV